MALLVGPYLLAQCFALPLVAFGPVWAVWPTLPDLLLLLIISVSLLYRSPVQTEAQRRVLFVLVLGTGLSVLALGLLVVFRDPTLPAQLSFGVFGVYKLIQITLLFAAISRLPISTQRLTRWGHWALAGLLIMSGTIIWSFFSPAISNALGEFLPRGRPASGPWEAYYLHQDPGLGMVGYNHGFVAAQLVTLYSLTIMLRGRSSALLAGLMLIACFLTGSRAGLAGALLTLALEYRRMPIRAAVWLLCSSVAAWLLLPILHLDSSFQALIERQSTLVEASDPNNLSGRDSIWQTFAAALLRDPLRLLIGSGFGSAIALGGNAHMNALQILFELGLAGLSVYTLLFVRLVGGLWRSPFGCPALYLLAGLALTTLSQETFYPNPAFSGFLPLLAVLIALSLRRSEAVTLMGEPSVGGQTSPRPNP
ncbi:hypothetical protein F8S09_17135 [Deinococcus sp. SDU3-2]|uniref:O-antigen ligase-related domain-containing protein n=1 Tax=Deinococcus terrestris TaxID=2651870 RepID=A0A7X1TTD5_9DEIO|nr:O-antigen ligase family protein [Deinococcus terrestris]MPY68379.1 hypothetical protein [Deinococcus terrestris]